MASSLRKSRRKTFDHVEGGKNRSSGWVAMLHGAKAVASAVRAAGSCSGASRPRLFSTVPIKAMSKSEDFSREVIAPSAPGSTSSSASTKKM